MMEQRPLKPHEEIADGQDRTVPEQHEAFPPGTEVEVVEDPQLERDRRWSGQRFVVASHHKPTGLVTLQQPSVACRVHWKSLRRV